MLWYAVQGTVSVFKVQDGLPGFDVVSMLLGRFRVMGSAKRDGPGRSKGARLLLLGCPLLPCCEESVEADGS